MISFIAVWLAGLPPAPLQDAAAFEPGPRRVQMRASKYYDAPKSPKKKVGKAEYGEQVTALAKQGIYVKVRRSNGTEAWIYGRALIAPDRFNPNPENEKEKMELNAQNYKSGRFDNDTEKEYIKRKGPRMQRAYAALDALMNRGAGRAEAADGMLLRFRKDGKLGEFSSVK